MEEKQEIKNKKKQRREDEAGKEERRVHINNMIREREKAHRRILRTKFVPHFQSNGSAPGKSVSVRTTTTLHAIRAYRKKGLNINGEERERVEEKEKKRERNIYSDFLASS